MSFIMTFSCVWFDHVQPLHLLSSSHWSPSSYWSSCFHDPVSSIRIAYESWGRGYLHKHRLRGSGTKENVSASLTTTSCLYKSSGRHETLRPPHPMTGCWQVQPHAEGRAYEFTAAVEPSRMQHLSHAQKTAFHNTPPFLQLLHSFHLLLLRCSPD